MPCWSGRPALGRQQLLFNRPASPLHKRRAGQADAGAGRQLGDSTCQRGPGGGFGPWCRLVSPVTASLVRLMLATCRQRSSERAPLACLHRAVHSPSGTRRGACYAAPLPPAAVNPERACCWRSPGHVCRLARALHQAHRWQGGWRGCWAHPQRSRRSCQAQRGLLPQCRHLHTLA